MKLCVQTDPDVPRHDQIIYDDFNGAVECPLCVALYELEKANELVGVLERRIDTLESQIVDATA